MKDLTRGERLQIMLTPQELKRWTAGVLAPHAQPGGRRAGAFKAGPGRRRLRHGAKRQQIARISASPASFQRHAQKGRTGFWRMTYRAPRTWAQKIGARLDFMGRFPLNAPSFGPTGWACRGDP